jgi:hypothetical protein
MKQFCAYPTIWLYKTRATDIIGQIKGSNDLLLPSKDEINKYESNRIMKAVASLLTLLTQQTKQITHKY